MSLADLARHVTSTHHELINREAPRLVALLPDVVSARPALAGVARVFGELVDDLHPHLMKEEHVLFPLITAIEDAVTHGRPLPASPEGPLHVMAIEHEAVERLLAELRELTGGYVVPEGASGGHRTLLEGLRAFDEDLVRHLEVENDIMFPRVRSLVARAAKSSSSTAC